MIDTVYKTLLTILNKEQNGYITPTEFNLLANNVQNEIFKEYFEDYNRGENKENRGLTNRGYGNLTFNERQRIQQFAVSPTIIAVGSGVFALPSNLYFIEDKGVITGSAQTYPSVLVDEVERGEINVLNRSLSKPTALYPVYERYGTNITVSPVSITQVVVSYIRKPKFPNWTYTLVGGQPMHNPADVSFQDFDLHVSEFSNIVLKMLSYFGINLRENEVVQIAEVLKDKMNLKDNG